MDTVEIIRCRFEALAPHRVRRASDCLPRPRCWPRPWRRDAGFDGDGDCPFKHLPPGTSKWNRRGKTLANPATIVNLIGSTTTSIKIGKPEMAALDIRRADFHGDWNCTLFPTPSTSP